MGSPGVASFDDAISPLRQAPPDPTPFTYNLWGLPTRLTVFLLALHLFASVKIILRIDRIPGTTFFSLDQQYGRRSPFHLSSYEVPEVNWQRKPRRAP